MSVRLYHPETGGEFAAPEPAVPQYQRAGWVPLADWKAQQARKNGSNISTATAGKAEVADTKE